MPDELYLARRGTTDSELLFLLMVAEGLDQDPEQAIRRVLAIVQASMRDRGQTLQMRLTCVMSDGDRLFAYRHASDDKRPTLYVSQGFAPGGATLASEPLDAGRSHWRLLPSDRLHAFDVERAERPASARLAV